MLQIKVVTIADCVRRSAAIAAAMLMVAAVNLPPTTTAAQPGIAAGWNEAQIAWRTYDVGLAEAKRTGKPVMVVVHTTWCPYCKQYQTLFKDPRVVAAASRLVLVMVDRDQDKELNVRLGPPGQTYIPRTLFLTPDGALMADVAVPTAGREHLVDYYDPDELLSLMAKAAEHSPPPN